LLFDKLATNSSFVSYYALFKIHEHTINNNFKINQP